MQCKWFDIICRIYLQSVQEIQYLKVKYSASIIRLKVIIH